MERPRYWALLLLGGSTWEVLAGTPGRGLVRPDEAGSTSMVLLELEEAHVCAPDEDGPPLPHPLDEDCPALPHPMMGANGPVSVPHTCDEVVEGL